MTEHAVPRRALWYAWAAAAACGPADRRERAPAGPPAAAETPVDTRTGPGIRFGPAALRPGARVGGVVVDSVAARLAVDGATWVGTARFHGEMTLRGRTVPHPDSDVRAVCFEADSASAARMPRWAGDARRPWFCFANTADAARALAPPREARTATVVIDRFTIHRGLSDEVNEARLVRVVHASAAERARRTPSGQ